MEKKTSEAQIRASRKWESENKDRARYLSARRAARSFINTRATLEDLDELKQLIHNKELELKVVEKL